MRMGLLVAGVLAIVACERAPGARTDSTAARAPRSDSLVTDSLMAVVAPAAAVTLALRDLPGKEDSILVANRMTREQFDGLMYRIALDPEARRLFETATRR